MEQFQNFLKVLAALDRCQVEYILVGGVAMIFHGMERLTRDIDLFIRRTPENVERLRQALHSVFDDPSIEEITREELSQYPVIRYGTPDDFYIDVMTRLGTFAGYDDLEYECIGYEGITIRIATPETLIWLKKDTVREKDTLDVRFLETLLNRKNGEK